MENTDKTLATTTTANENNTNHINSGLKSRHKKYRRILKNLTLMSDVFMRNVLKEQKCTEYILQIILERENLKVIDQVLQKDYKNLQGRSAILDCVAQDAAGSLFNIEIQQENEGASPKRARYHSGLMDMSALNPGQNFKELPETYIIFITQEDTLKSKLPIYHIERSIKETGEDFKDESHIIYVVSKNQEDTALGRLMHDFHCKNAKEMYNEILAQRVYELKETQEGVEIMCREMDKIYKEGEEYGMRRGRAEGFAAGELKKAHETAISLSARKISAEEIADILKISVKVVQEWLTSSTNYENLHS